MKILVSGAAGFLGYYLAKTLADDPANHILCVDNNVRGTRDSLYDNLIARPNVEHFDIDLCEADELSALPDNVDLVYHLAALNGTQNFYEQPFDVVRCCTLPTLHLLQKYARSASLKRFIYAGTSESYASIVTRFGWEVPTGEDVPLGIDDIFNPRWSYAASKMHGEIATVTACGQYDVPFTIIRYHNAYGPRMGDKHVVPDFYSRARDGIYALYGFEDTRSFIYADDAVRATIALANCAAAAGEVVNVGGDRELSMEALGEIMMQVAGLEGKIALHPSPSGSVKRRCPKVDKLRSLTGFEEQWSLEDGLRETARFYLGPPD
jgi:UDP-glucose 4-epimerase